MLPLAIAHIPLLIAIAVFAVIALTAWVVPTGPVPGACPNGYNARPVFPVEANTQIWEGEMVAINGNGNLVPCTDTAGLIYKGIAFESVNNIGGAAQAVGCQVQPDTVNQGQYIRFNCTSPAWATWMEQHVFCLDPTTVGLAASSVNKVIVGTVYILNATGVAGAVTVNTSQKAALATS